MCKKTAEGAQRHRADSAQDLESDEFWARLEVLHLFFDGLEADWRALLAGMRDSRQLAAAAARRLGGMQLQLHAVLNGQPKDASRG